MLKREISPELHECCTEYPVVTVLGPRQSGKTVLVRENFPGKKYLSLEDPDIRQAAELDPRGFLRGVTEGAILDEIQRLPILLSYLQGIVDDEPQPGKFILTGSHQPDLHNAVSQSLAGRTALLTLLPLNFAELSQINNKLETYELISNGFFPALRYKNLKPERFYNGYLQTYVERDVRALINLKDLSRFQQFLTLLAGRIGQVVNYTSLSNDIGVSATTIKSWISVLKATYVVFELPPFYENIKKRVVKSPKIYFADTGLVSFLLGIRSAEQAARDPLRGGLYENLLILELMKRWFNKGRRADFYFFRDTHGNEVDLLIRDHGKLLPVEIKSSATFSKRFLKGIERFRKLTPHCRQEAAVLFDGDRKLLVKETHILNLLEHKEECEVVFAC
ncbi:MAG: ATP-binding protein [Thermodesulfobacteriota bacterium]|nr:ATP-binding protein [Thermodesulfobacteriota bacterium]